MRGPENGEPWSFIAAARFDADESVLNDIDPADAMLAGQRVRGEEELEGACGRLGRSDQLDWNPSGEDNCEVFWRVRGGGHGGGEFPHIVRWSRVRVF